MILCPICEASKGLGRIRMEVCRKCLKMLNIEQLRYRDDFRNSLSKRLTILALDRGTVTEP